MPCALCWGLAAMTGIVEDMGVLYFEPHLAVPLSFAFPSPALRSYDPVRVTKLPLPSTWPFWAVTAFAALGLVVCNAARPTTRIRAVFTILRTAPTARASDELSIRDLLLFPRTAHSPSSSFSLPPSRTPRRVINHFPSQQPLRVPRPSGNHLAHLVDRATISRQPSRARRSS